MERAPWLYAALEMETLLWAYLPILAPRIVVFARNRRSTGRIAR